jgi:hypothetical protein
LIGKILGNNGAVITAAGNAVQGVAEVLTPSATRRLELSAEAQMGALNAMGAEFSSAGSSWFDSLVNGLNRLPRPLLALGTVGLFAYAMIDPWAFSQRMVGLNAVPEPLWWLLGAVVAFYFGARETHYFRETRNAAGRVVIPQIAENPAKTGADNPALAEWQGGK